MYICIAMTSSRLTCLFRLSVSWLPSGVASTTGLKVGPSINLSLLLEAFPSPPLMKCLTLNSSPALHEPIRAFKT